MKLLVILIYCVLVVSPSCVKVTHMRRSHAEFIDITISDIYNNTQDGLSRMYKNESEWFQIDDISTLSLTPAGSDNIEISYDEIFPLMDSTVCTEKHPSSGGGCPGGGCCKVSISLYSITHAMDVSVMLTARINRMTTEGNHEFWICQQQMQGNFLKPTFCTCSCLSFFKKFFTSFQ